MFDTGILQAVNTDNGTITPEHRFVRIEQALVKSDDRNEKRFLALMEQIDSLRLKVYLIAAALSGATSIGTWYLCRVL
jgi:hypothetical protein